MTELNVPQNCFKICIYGENEKIVVEVTLLLGSIVNIQKHYPCKEKKTLLLYIVIEDTKRLETKKWVKKVSK